MGIRNFFFYKTLLRKEPALGNPYSEGLVNLEGIPHPPAGGIRNDSLFLQIDNLDFFIRIGLGR